jgi:type II secretory pathway component PulM
MKEKFLAFWHSRNPREQKILASGTLLLVLALLYAYVWLPMNQQRERLRQQVPVMAGQLAQMKAQAREIGELSASAATAQRGAVADLLNQSAAPAGVKGELTQVTSLAPDRAQVTLNSIAFDKWLGWVKILQTQYALRIESAQIAAASEPGMVRVQAVLVSPAH